MEVTGSTGESDISTVFLAEQKERAPAAVRAACFLGILAFIAFAYVDLLLVESAAGLIVARAAIVGAIVIIFAVTFTRLGRARIEWVASVACLTVGGGVVLVTDMTGGATSRYHEALLLTMFGFALLIPWRTVVAGLTFGALNVAYDVVLLLEGKHHPLGIWATNNFVLWSAAVISTVGVLVSNRLRWVEFENRWRLAKANEKLLTLDRMKNEFFANVSHELRTPLTLILAPVDELLSQELQDGLRDTLTVIRRNAERLLRLIDDLLDLARLEVGGLRLVVAELDLVELVDKVVASCRPAARARGIELSRMSSTVSNIWGDSHRVEMVLMNLLGNALKFTPAGGRIEVRLAPKDGGAAISVSDTGPGIPDTERKRIFERFYQIEGSQRRRFGGAGIGLALANELIRLHDGSLELESKVGEGSTFTMNIPSGSEHFRPEVVERRRRVVDTSEGRRAGDKLSQAPWEAPDEPLPPETGLPRPEDRIVLDRGRRARVLLAEDEDDLRQFIAGILSEEFEVTTAKDGAEALELIRGVRPDLVVSDVMMPRFSGNDLCRALRADHRLKSTPVILLTARAGTESTLEAYASGADDFVPKPFHSRVLVARVRAQLKLRALGLQLAAQATLASAGTLAAGVAHEVRNPLNAIMNAASVLRKSPEHDTASRLLAVIDQCSHRILSIIEALDDQVRPAEGGAIAPCDVRAGIEATISLLEHRVRDTRIHRDYQSSRRVVASAQALNQVFLNLLDNALRSGAKNLWVSSADSQSSLQVRIEDDGPGIPADIASHIFEPFFTTRPVGEGTGLGLYLCRRLIAESGGEIRYEDRAQGGARFVIDLPVETFVESREGTPASAG